MWFYVLVMLEKGDISIGFRKQTSRLPLRFFEEQLADNKEIVFTGMKS